MRDLYASTNAIKEKGLDYFDDLSAQDFGFCDNGEIKYGLVSFRDDMDDIYLYSIDEIEEAKVEMEIDWDTLAVDTIHVGVMEYLEREDIIKEFEMNYGWDFISNEETEKKINEILMLSVDKRDYALDELAKMHDALTD